MGDDFAGMPVKKQNRLLRLAASGIFVVLIILLAIVCLASAVCRRRPR